MRSITVVLKIPPRIADAIAYARHIATEMDGNPYFPSPPVSMATLSSLIATVEAARTAARRRTEGTAAAAKARWLDVHNALEQERNYVQHTARQYPPEVAELVAVSSGMSVKGTGGRKQVLFHVEHGEVSGTVKLSAHRPRRGSSFDWQYGTDGVHWLDAPRTNGSTTLIGGLTPGVLYYFRYRTLTDDVLSDWSDPFTFRVN
jgi:hypothetical protein